MIDKNYEFQKLLIEKHPNNVAENIPEEKIHKKLIKEYRFAKKLQIYNL